MCLTLLREPFEPHLKLSQFRWKKIWCSQAATASLCDPVRIVDTWSSNGRRGKLTQADARRGVGSTHLQIVWY